MINYSFASRVLKVLFMEKMGELVKAVHKQDRDEESTLTTEMDALSFAADLIDSISSGWEMEGIKEMFFNRINGHEGNKEDNYYKDVNMGLKKPSAINPPKSKYRIEDELNKVSKVVNRARSMKLDRGPKSTQFIDVSLACYQFEIRIEDWIEAKDGDFAHDFLGIQEYMNRSTGVVGGDFLPKFAGI